MSVGESRNICGAGSEERRRTEALVQQALEAVSRASKGFSLQLCTQTRPAIGDLLAPPLRAAIHIPQACLHHSASFSNMRSLLSPVCN